MRNSLKSIELGIYPKEPLKEESENIKDNFNENKEDIIIEEESNWKTISNYQYHLEFNFNKIKKFKLFF